MRTKALQSKHAKAINYLERLENIGHIVGMTCGDRLIGESIRSCDTTKRKQ